MDSTPAKIRQPLKAGVLYDNRHHGTPAVYVRLEPSKSEVRPASQVYRESMKALLRHGAVFVLDFEDHLVEGAFGLVERMLADSDSRFVLVRHGPSYELVERVRSLKDERGLASPSLVVYAPTSSTGPRLIRIAETLGPEDELVLRMKTDEDRERFLEYWADLRAVLRVRKVPFGIQIVAFHVEHDTDQTLVGSLSENGEVALYGFGPRYVGL